MPLGQIESRIGQIESTIARMQAMVMPVSGSGDHRFGQAFDRQVAEYGKATSVRQPTPGEIMKARLTNAFGADGQPTVDLAGMQQLLAAGAIGGVAPAAGVAPGQGANGLAATTPFGEAIVQLASQHIGKNYVWGGESDAEGGYDCSGLVQDAFKRAGISMPRVARDQQHMGVRVPSLDQAMPGDLLTFGNPATHIGIYAGNGEWIEAPRRGLQVRRHKLTRKVTDIRRIVPPGVALGQVSPQAARGGSYVQVAPVGMRQGGLGAGTLQAGSLGPGSLGAGGLPGLGGHMVAALGGQSETINVGAGFGLNPQLVQTLLTHGAAGAATPSPYSNRAGVLTPGVPVYGPAVPGAVSQGAAGAGAGVIPGATVSGGPFAGGPIAGSTPPVPVTTSTSGPVSGQMVITQSGPAPLVQNLTGHAPVPVGAQAVGATPASVKIFNAVQAAAAASNDPEYKAACNPYDTVTGVPYAEHFNEAGRKYGISPRFLAAIAKTESDFRPQLVSRAGAVGVMQLMPVTAREVGVPVEQRTIPSVNIDGASHYIAKYFAKQPNVSVGLAAYNAGPGAVVRAGGVPNYTETKNYVRKVRQALAAIC